jgi:hypothetical protein
MIKFVVAGITLVALIVGGGLSYKNSTKQQEEGRHSSSKIKAYTQKAKKEGKTSVSVPAAMPEYIGGMESADDVLSNLSLVIAEAIENKTYVHEADSIVTWYKFRIVEHLSQHHTVTYFHPGPPPEDFLPLNEDEFLIDREGGTVIFDGVRATTVNAEFPPFLTHKQYLLVIITKSSGVATLWGGPTGAFAVSPDGRIEPLSKRPHHFKEAMKNRFGNSLGQIKQHLAKG